ncbi:MAG: hypothetical protein U9R49_15640, partial [Bacteroidota bacterium]|nr:hypothetical protein [Bacteroidota bacterium]
PLPESLERENLPVGIFSHKKEQASPGYYSVEFENYNVSAELTASARVGMHRYSYRKGAEKRLLVDVGHILQRTWGHENAWNRLEVIDRHTLQGFKYSTGWSHDHRIYFRIEFSSPFSVDKMLFDGALSDNLDSISGQNVWAFLSFNELAEGETLLIKAGRNTSHGL